MTTTTVSDPEGPALADEIEYSITITGDHRLLVNDASVSSPTIADGDSEELLSWALSIVAQKHDEIGGTLVLTVRDKRDGGYAGGVVRLPEGRNVLLGELQQREGHVYAQASRPVPEVVADDLDTTTPRRRRNARQTGPIAVEPEVTDAPQEATSEPVVVPAQAVEAQLPAYTQDAPVGEEHLDEAPVAQPDVAEATPASVETPETDHEQSAPAPLIQESEDWADHVVPVFPTQTSERPEPVVERKQESSLTTPIPYARNRPQADVIEGKRIDLKRRRRNRIILAGAAVVVVGVIGAAWLVSQGKTAYAAVCIDERTMARQATDTACEPEAGSSPYYRWWFTPEGNQVPAVGDFAQAGQGTINTPARGDATISYGYEEDGGVFER